MTEFLPRDPTKALVDVKEKLYERLDILRTCLKDREKDDYGYIFGEDHMMANEVLFLENLLDIIERSV